jgi:hypothetical protein
VYCTHSRSQNTARERVRSMLKPQSLRVDTPQVRLRRTRDVCAGRTAAVLLAVHHLRRPTNSIYMITYASRRYA